MYKGKPQGDGNHPNNDQNLYANIFDFQNKDQNWDADTTKQSQTTKIVGTKKVLTRKGNHIGESMKLSERRQKILDQSLSAALNRLEDQFQDFKTNNSLKSKR